MAPKDPSIPTAAATTTAATGLSVPSISPSPSNEAMVAEAPEKSSIDKNDDDESSRGGGSLAIVQTPTDRDVLCGRGMRIRKHPGNVLYNNLLRAYYGAYKLAPKGSKAGIVKAILAFVREGQSAGPGRFLEKTKIRNSSNSNNHGSSSSSSLWVYIDIGHERAMNKTAQAFRDIKVTPDHTENRSFLLVRPRDDEHPQQPPPPPPQPSSSRRPTFRERLAMLRRQNRERGRGTDADSDEDGGSDSNDDGVEDVSDTETEESFSMYESPPKR